MSDSLDVEQIIADMRGSASQQEIDAIVERGNASMAAYVNRSTWHSTPRPEAERSDQVAGQ